MSEATTYTEEQLDALERIEKDWALSLPPQRTIRQVMELYPIAKASAMRNTRKRIKDIERQISNLTEVREMWYTAINKMAPKKQPGFISWLDGHIERLRETLEDDLKKYKRDLNYLKDMGSDGKTVPKSNRGVSEDQISRAKETRIKDIMTVKRGGKANCLWHDDENPSMQVYTNRVHCFVCGNHGDAIDVYMNINRVDFVTAVKALAV